MEAVTSSPPAPKLGEMEAGLAGCGAAGPPA